MKKLLKNSIIAFGFAVIGMNVVVGMELENSTNKYHILTDQYCDLLINMLESKDKLYKDIDNCKLQNKAINETIKEIESNKKDNKDFGSYIKYLLNTNVNSKMITPEEKTEFFNLLEKIEKPLNFINDTQFQSLLFEQYEESQDKFLNFKENNKIPNDIFLRILIEYILTRTR